MKTSIPPEPLLGITAVSGATTTPGKTSMPESVMTDAPKPKAAAVKDAEEVKGCARKCIDVQVQGDGGSNSPNANGKKRGRAWWGVNEPTT